MTLYEINQKLIETIESQCDLETGELLEGADLDNAINEIEMEINEKIENIGLFCKSLSSEVEALDKEIKSLQDRKKSKENKIKSLSSYLKGFLLLHKVPKFETPRLVLKFRKSKTVEVLDINKVPRAFIKEKEVVIEESVDKMLVKSYLKEHKDETINGIEIVENQNLNIL